MKPAQTRKRERLKQYLANRDVHCPECGYNLRGLEDVCCPECGYGFDDITVRQFGRKVPRSEWVVDSPGFHCAFAFMVAAIVVYPSPWETVSLNPRSGGDPIVFLGMMGGLVYSVWWLELVEMGGPLLVIRARFGSTLPLPKWAQGPRGKWAVGLVGWVLAIVSFSIALLMRLSGMGV
jgi:hypothetical protein